MFYYRSFHYRSTAERHRLQIQRVCYLCHAPIKPKEGLFIGRFGILVHHDGICDRFVNMIHEETYDAGKRWPTAVRRRLDEYDDMSTKEVISRVRSLLWP